MGSFGGDDISGRRDSGDNVSEDVLDYQTVELTRATSGTDLWSTIEAALYAHIITRDPSIVAAEHEAIDDFVEAWESLVDRWDDAPGENKAPVLTAIGNRIATLASFGWFVHWGCIRRSVESADGETLPLPIAIISVDRQEAETIQVLVPEGMPLSLQPLDQEGDG